ncbi:MAG TPA: XTP/dITP diphosphatase [Clostridiales bacterium]|nr:XTP/dITP diphosphatase [Clostridiales bacterium]
MKKLIIATRNNGKVKEIKALLRPLSYDILSLGDLNIDIDIPEDGTTFEENAVKKAREICRLTGHLTLADDSGLEVFALNNAPGVHSARFAGEGASDEQNNRKLLTLMKNIQKEKRQARFRCCMALYYPEGKYITVEGICNGSIAFEPGGSNGFGYDPLFIVEGYDKTFAQLPSHVKDTISHRAKALQKLMHILAKEQEV